MIQALQAVVRPEAAHALDGLSNIAGPGMKPTNITPEVSFSQALAAVSQEAVGTLRNAETLSIGAIQGESDTRQVVDAVMSAEQTLQAAIAIRDKIVSSYLEISRMAI